MAPELGPPITAGSTYWKPVRILSSEDLPAPDGPMIAVSSPDWKHPDTPLRIHSETKKYLVLNMNWLYKP